MLELDQYRVEYKLVGGIEVTQFVEGESKEKVLDEAKLPLEYTFEDKNKILHCFSREDVVLISVSKVYRQSGFTSVKGTR